MESWCGLKLVGLRHCKEMGCDVRLLDDWGMGGWGDGHEGFFGMGMGMEGRGGRRIGLRLID